MNNVFKNLEVGMMVEITGDSFKNDTHGMPVGTLGIVEQLVPATKFEDLPPFVQFIYALDGQEGIDLPARVHISVIDDEDNDFDEPIFVNVLPDDLEEVAVIDLQNLVVAGTKDGTTTMVEIGQRVELLEDDLADGYVAGDIVVVESDNGEAVFIDRDGDQRFLESVEFKLVD